MSIDTAKMSARGQIVIPKDIRETVGARENTIFSIAAIEGRIVLKPLDTERIRRDLEDFRELRRKAPKYSQERIDRMVRDARQRIKDRA